MPTRRTMFLGGFVALGACSVRPLLQTVDDQNVREQLAAVRIVGLDGRLGQLVRNALLDEINPGAVDQPSRYLLSVRLQRSAQSLGIQLDDVITRFNLTLTARFELVDPSNGSVLYRSQVQRVASYNVAQQPYATLAAELDAERRVAKEVGNNIRALLAVHFAREAAST